MNIPDGEGNEKRPSIALIDGEAIILLAFKKCQCRSEDIYSFYVLGSVYFIGGVSGNPRVTAGTYPPPTPPDVRPSWGWVGGGAGYTTRNIQAGMIFRFFYVLNALFE